MGPSPSEGAELERRNSQESTNYRRPAEQQHQPSHHVQPSNPGKARGCGRCSLPWCMALRLLGQQPALLCEGSCCVPHIPAPAPANGPILPLSQATSSSSRRLSPTATRSRRHQPLHSAMLLLEGG